jgi:yeast amino acid transporter
MANITEEKVPSKDMAQMSINGSDMVEAGRVSTLDLGSTQLHRELKASQVQLYAIGAAIGTGVFVSMGSYLPNGGPAGLFLGFAIWSFVAYAVNECYAEMVCWAPVPAPFIRFASEWVDEALGFALSWSFYFNQVFL